MSVQSQRLRSTDTCPVLTPSINAVSTMVAGTPHIPAPAVGTSQWHHVDVSRYTACSHKAFILPPYRSSRKPLERGTSLLHYMVRTSGTLVNLPSDGVPM